MTVTKEIEELLRSEPKVLWSALKNVESLRRLAEKLSIFSGFRRKQFVSSQYRGLPYFLKAS